MKFDANGFASLGLGGPLLGQRLALLGPITLLEGDEPGHQGQGQRAHQQIDVRQAFIDWLRDPHGNLFSIAGTRCKVAKRKKPGKKPGLQVFDRSLQAA